MKSFNNAILDKDLVNRAIFVVCTTQFKKDAKEEHQIVKDAGYEIYKCSGEFRVKNNETGKVVSINYSWEYAKHRSVYQLSGRRSSDAEKANLVNYLDTPRNEAYRKQNDYEYNLSHKQWDWNDSRTKLKRARRDVNYHVEEIEKIKREMENLQQRLEYHVSEKVKDEIRLAEIKKEIGLGKWGG